MIDLSGAPFVAISEMISYLSTYGRLTHDYEALGLLLNTLKGFVGVKRQEFFDELLTKYDMMIPIASLPDISRWLSIVTSFFTNRIIIKELTQWAVERSRLFPPLLTAIANLRKVHGFYDKA